MLYTSDDLQAMKGTKLGNIINNIYKEKTQLNTYSKISSCGKYEFTQYGKVQYDFSYTLR